MGVAGSSNEEPRIPAHEGKPKRGVLPQAESEQLLIRIFVGTGTEPVPAERWPPAEAGKGGGKQGESHVLRGEWSLHSAETSRVAARVQSKPRCKISSSLAALAAFRAHACTLLELLVSEPMDPLDGQELALNRAAPRGAVHCEPRRQRVRRVVGDAE